MEQVINVLGVNYTLKEEETENDVKLQEVAGYCDHTVKLLVVDNMSDKDEMSLNNLDSHKKKVCRHEIIHAFLYESGMSVCCNWATEEMVDWLAIQAPKMFEEFKKANLL